ncbi:MAG: alpha/beta hydrolase [Ectothiorhodospiraceae bacterium]|nr:alpha/beta hydrolase [Ectothiorhodospiraceae bacterium]
MNNTPAADTTAQPLGLTASQALHLFTRPRRIPPQEQEQQLMARGRERVVNHAGRQLRGWIWGSRGPDVLLAHGWDSRASHLAAFVAPLLSNGYRVTAFDAPAHGASEGNQSHVIDIGRALLQIHQEAGPGDAVVAHSVGSPALLYALANGLTTRASVHIAGPASLRRVLIAFATACRVPEDDIPGFLALVAEHIGMPLEQMEVASLASGMRHPALLLHAPEDREIPYSDSLALHKLWRGSALMDIPGAGHRRIVADPRTLDATLQFLLRATPHG